MRIRLSEQNKMGAVALLLMAALVAVPAFSWAASVVGCELSVSGDLARVEIKAEGDWSHRSFRVEGPDRLVVDIIGAVNESDVSKLVGDGRLVKSVRTSQFSVEPQAVTRVVLDLVAGASATTSRTASGLEVFVTAAGSEGEAAHLGAAVEPATELVPTAGMPSVVYEAEATGADVDHWQDEGSLGRLAEPQRRDEDGSYARTMSINMQNADIRTILRAIADFSGRNIIASPEVVGTVTVALTDVPWREALSVILRANGFDYVEEEGIFRVDTAEKLRDEELAEKAAAQRSAELEPLVTRIIPIDYANAEEVKDSVKSMLSGRGAVEVDKRTNALIVSDIVARVEEVETLARDLDTRTPQVHIDALMVDIDARKSRELGVKWGLLNAAPTDVNGVGDINVDRSITESAGTLRVGTVQNWGEIQFQLQSLQKDNVANIISNPRITTTDNREASILVGQKIPLITQDVAGNPVTRLEVIGIRLVVTPHINSDRQITLDVHPEVSDLSNQATVQGGVIINTSEADTRVLVSNRETAVIAGLIRNVTTEFTAGVPVLKDLPLVGGLFRTKSNSAEQRELIVFLTPRIVESDDDVATERHWQVRDDVEALIESTHGSVMR